MLLPATRSVTLSIFPGVLAEDLHSEALGSWLPVILITSYNCADWAGKSLPGWAVLRLRCAAWRGWLPSCCAAAALPPHCRHKLPPARRRDERAILALALGRALFIPAFALASARQAALPLMLALAGALGCSNGYCCACAMMRAPAAVPPAAAGLAGNLMVLFLVLGLCLGAGASFIWLVPLR